MTWIVHRGRLYNWSDSVKGKHNAEAHAKVIQEGNYLAKIVYNPLSKRYDVFTSLTR